MLRTISFSLIVTLLAAGAAAAADDLLATARARFQPIPREVPELPGNPATPAKLELGRMLYFDPRVSASRPGSCNSCHNVGLGGADGRETAIGHSWQKGGRNVPTAFNAVFNTARFWDGRAQDLDDKAGGPPFNPVELALPRDQLSDQLAGIPGYRAAFGAAFPGEVEPVTLANAQKAIAVFQATLITPNAPFDRYLRGDTAALGAAQKDGLRLFISKGCAECHDGMNLGGNQYAPFGILERPGADVLPRDDKGRFMVTDTVGDQYVFKVPQLRNIALTAPYFHSGRAWDLAQAVAVMAASQIGAPVSAEEVGRITAFLESLTGEQPGVTYPALPPAVGPAPLP
ncbi:MAG: cytochrome-c peroxidase [Gammaproteobacteria bacterium]|nr:cytochrome-c peroxidase [Gammaproteobacteria bacterium]